MPHAESQALGAKARGALAYEADGNGSMILKQHAILAHLKRDAMPEGFEENVRRHFALKRGVIIHRLRQWMREVVTQPTPVCPRK